MRKTVSLKVEQLEDRTVPATFGHPWADATHITLSFAPDGTIISGVANNLNSTLSALGTDSAKFEILRAFQTWVANSNINIGLVTDNGDPWDAPGQVQADPRFGDIRIGGRTWAADVLSLTTPFNYFNTQSGNVALNTAGNLTIGGANATHDLYTVVLQESAHSLGVGNSTDTTSAMYEYYKGVRTGISAGDITSIQALYGARRADAYEGATGNDTMATATTYAGPLTADLTTVSDVDTYRFTTLADGTPTVVHLKALGVSFVQANVQVLDQNGQLVVQGASQSVTNNDVTLTLSNLQPSGTYYVRVSTNRTDVFGVGSYQLTIDGTTAGASSGTSAAAVDLVSGAHSTFDTAAVLTQRAGSVSPQLDAIATLTFDVQTNSTYFRVHAPTAAAGQVVHLVSSVYDLATLQDVKITVFDAAHNQLNARILGAGTGSTVVEVDNVAPSADYFICVNATTSFKFTVDFTTQDVPFEMSSTGGPASGTTQSATLSVSQSQVMYLALSADGDSGAAIALTIRDANGNVVCVVTSYGGSTRSASVFLAAGVYKVSMTLSPNASNPTATLTYRLFALGITDPIGSELADPTQNPAGANGGTTPPPAANGAIIYWIADAPGNGSVWF